MISGRTPGSLALSYRILGLDENRSFYGFDLWVDGILTHTHWEKPAVHMSGALRWPLSPDGAERTMRHVTLYLPYSADCAVSDVVLEGASRLERGTDRGGLLLCYGDSITQGYDAIHPSLTYANLLARSLGLELLNQGISGYVFDPDTVDADSVPTPEIVTVAYGTNDWTNKESLEEIRTDMDRYLDRLAASFPKSRLYVILPIWRGDTAQPTAVGDFAPVLEALRASARRYPQIKVLNGQRAVPHCQDFFADAILHPTDTGMLLYAQWLSPQIAADQLS